jgi:thymidylate kinase
MDQKLSSKDKFIALSGIDGSGKSTQLELIKDSLINDGKKVIFLWTRGGSTPGINALKKIIRIVAGNKLPPSGHSKKRDQMLATGWIQRIWITLAILDLLRIYGFSIRWQILRGNVVLCDRYLWDTYIDFKIMFPDIKITNWLIWKILVKLSPIPNKAFLLVIPAELSEERCSNKYDPFPDTSDIRKIRYDLYERTSKLGHWDIIDANDSIETVFKRVMNNQ